jgi:hypothetical protein
MGMKTFWLSFAPEAGPGKVILIDAEYAQEAHAAAHAFGAYSPGDETLIFEIPEGTDEHQLPRNRVLTLDEARAAGAKTLGDVHEDFGCEAAASFSQYRFGGN